MMMLDKISQYIEDQQPNGRIFLGVYFITAVTRYMWELKQLVGELKRIDRAGQERSEFLEEYLYTRDVLWMLGSSARDVALMIDPEFSEILEYYDKFSVGRRLKSLK